MVFCGGCLGSVVIFVIGVVLVRYVGQTYGTFADINPVTTMLLDRSLVGFVLGSVAAYGWLRWRKRP